jgi:acetoin utilization deacetylase AcuC-like enzyme
MSLRLFHCDHHPIPLPPGHKFPAEKYRLLRESLEQVGIFRIEPAKPATRESIELAHDSAYVSGFLEGTLDPMAMRRIGFPWSRELVARTLASVGGTMAASMEALVTGIGGNLAGGTHHAFRSEGGGFCVFNDIAIAILALRHAGRVRRAAVIDLDVHQGDGTAAIFAGDPSVFTISLHGQNNFPFRKRQSRIDVDLPDATGDDEYLSALDRVLPRVIEFAPDIVFYQAGVDALAGDTLGRLALTVQGLGERDRRVMELCGDCRIPLAITLGGGYAHPISRSVEAHANTFRTAAETFSALSTRGIHA